MQKRPAINETRPRANHSSSIPSDHSLLMRQYTACRDRESKRKCERFQNFDSYKFIPSNPAPMPTWSMPATFRMWLMCAEMGKSAFAPVPIPCALHLAPGPSHFFPLCSGFFFFFGRTRWLGRDERDLHLNSRCEPWRLGLALSRGGEKCESVFILFLGASASSSQGEVLLIGIIRFFWASNWDCVIWARECRVVSVDCLSWLCVSLEGRVFSFYWNLRVLCVWIDV